MFRFVNIDVVQMVLRKQNESHSDIVLPGPLLKGFNEGFKAEIRKHKSLNVLCIYKQEARPESQCNVYN